MLDIYRRRLAVSPLLAYSASAFWLEICEFGGLETAKRLIHNEEVGVGFVALCQFERLDLTLEALIHDNPEWHALFSKDELAVCAARLRRYGYQTVGRRLPADSSLDSNVA